MEVKGIDVSKHQGVIDWPKVAAAGYKFVIIRAGWSWYEGGLSVDSTFVGYIEGAQAAGLDVGVYVYSYDQSAAAAKIAAQQLLKLIKPYKLTYPVFFDMEYEPFNLSAGKALNTAICKAFMSTIEQAGYYAALYASTDFMLNYLDMSQLSTYDVWAAQYASKCTYPGSYGMWQYGVIGSYGTKGKDYTIDGAVPGINANCDLDIAYRDYPSLIKGASLNGWGKTDVPDDSSAAALDYKALYAAELAAHDALKSDFAAYKAGIRAELAALLESYK